MKNWIPISTYKIDSLKPYQMTTNFRDFLVKLNAQKTIKY